MTGDTFHPGAHDDQHPASCLLNRKMRKLAVWTGILAGVTVLLFLLPIWAGNSWDIIAGSLVLLLASLVGLLFWMTALVIGGLACDYRTETRFQKTWILIGFLSGFSCFVTSMYLLRIVWIAGAVIGLVLGLLACLYVLALGNMVDWVVRGFRQGLGFRRLAVPVGTLTVLVIYGLIFGAGSACALGIQATVVGWFCGIRRDLEWQSLAYRVGWFAGVMTLLIAFPTLHRGGHPLLRAGGPWGFPAAVIVGIAAWAITLLIGRRSGRTGEG